MSKTRWSEDEDEALKRLWPNASSTALTLAIPGRSYEGMGHRARKLRVKRINQHRPPRVVKEAA